MRDCKHGRMARKCEVCELEKEANELRAQLTEAQQLAETLFSAIAHGDDDHRAWLQEAISNHFSGKPIPAPRGLGTKEAVILDLQQRLAAAEQAEPKAWYINTPHGEVSTFDPAVAREWLLVATEQQVKKLYTSPPPSAGVPTKQKIREIFLAHGFTIKAGCNDLKPYVYEAAYALLQSSPPAPKGEREGQ